jgi:putative NADH-flavin reductase
MSATLTSHRLAAGRPALHNTARRCPSLQPMRRSINVVRASSFELDPDNASILVAGGGGVALSVTRKLKDMGSWVWQLQRTENHRKDIEGMMAIVVKGDATNSEDVEKAFASIDGVEAVISSVGGTTADPTADSLGNITLIEAAARHGVKKFILVTSIGAGDSKQATPPQVYETLKPVLLEKEKAEARLREMGSTMDFVIIRPGGLKSEPATGKGILTEDTTVCGAITREDVATLVVKSLFSKNASGKTLSAVDPDQLFGNPKVEEFKL